MRILKLIITLISISSFVYSQDQTVNCNPICLGTEFTFDSGCQGDGTFTYTSTFGTVDQATGVITITAADYPSILADGDDWEIDVTCVCNPGGCSYTTRRIYPIAAKDPIECYILREGAPDFELVNDCEFTACEGETIRIWMRPDPLTQQNIYNTNWTTITDPNGGVFSPDGLTDPFVMVPALEGTYTWECVSPNGCIDSGTFTIEGKVITMNNSCN